MRRLLRRGVSELELRRLRKQPNARLEESVISKLATPKQAVQLPQRSTSKFS
jgi:hypothetical protein